MIHIPYKPREYQKIIHENLQRFSVLVCHRRFGKTVLCVNELLKGAIECPRKRPRFAYIAPFYNMAKEITWDFFKEDFAKPLIDAGLVKVKESDPVRLDFKPNGARIYLFGADNPGRLRGQGFDGVVMDEVAMMREQVWREVVRPTLSDRKGWAIFIGTPQGRNYFYEIFERAKKDPTWYADMFRASETDVLDPDELEAIKRELGMDAYMQEYECSFDAALKGTYWANTLNDMEANGQWGEVQYDPEIPVHTAWDLGMNDSTAIWFFQKMPGGRINVIEYHEDSNEGIKYYAQLLKDKGYYYGDHFGPWDLEHRELGTGKTVLETARKYGLHFKVVPKLPLRDGIQAVRNVLPKCYFNEKTTQPGYEYLRVYRKDYNDKMKIFKNKPRHDMSSHAADAMRTLALAYRGEARAGLPRLGKVDMRRIDREITEPNQYINPPKVTDSFDKPKIIIGKYKHARIS